MPHNVEPQVYFLAKSELDEGAASDWLLDSGVSDTGIERLLSEKKTHAEKLVELAGRRCYKSFEVGLNPNVTKTREDVTEYIDNILKVGHGSVLEHVSFTFAIENVSRVFTGEMNRHRAGMAISEGSMRYIRFEDIPYWIPTCIQSEFDDRVNADDLLSHKESNGAFPINMNAEDKKSVTRHIFDQAFKKAEEFYAILAETWKEELAPESKFALKKEITSMMRRIIPMGVATGGLWTGNIRSLRHIFNMRCAPEAEEEIRLVGIKMLEGMIQNEPSFFRDFKKQENGTYKPEHKKV